MSAIVKRCACGREYTLSDFRCLLFRGCIIIDGRRPGEPFALEQRDCHCGSSIVIGIDEDGTINLNPLED